MNVKRVVEELKRKYPDKKIIQNKDKAGGVTEIICEVDPASKHPQYSVAIAVVDKIQPHYHKQTTEIYKILKGKLKLYKDGKDFVFKVGDRIIINPGEVHSGEGREVWLEVISKPGWKPEDHFLLRR